MADIQPLAAIRYTRSDQTSLVSPPYDVLSAQDKRKYLAGDPHNIVAIDLPHAPAKQAGPKELYDDAARIFQNWLSTGVLRRDSAPALYAYQQTYMYNGARYQRRGLFCRVRLEPLNTTGAIHPHEQTFSAPKEDRLMLMRATRANLSPVFGLFDDPDNRVTGRLFAAVANRTPTAAAKLPAQDGHSQVISDLWSVPDAAAIADVQELFRDKHIYIADGHHRYTTCLLWRRELAAPDGGSPPGAHPADFALFVLVAMHDPGLIVLPTHRAAANLRGFSCAALLQASAGRLRRLPGSWTGARLGELEKKLPEFGLHAMGIYDPARDEAIVVQPTQPDPLAALGNNAALDGKSAAWRQLDTAILQHFLFESILSPHFTAAQPLHWAFPHEAREVTQLCRGGEFQAGFLLQPTPLDAVRELGNAHELMPQKSTFFYPKPATGMVINPLW